MFELVFAFLFMLALVAAMAVGVTFGRAPIAGTCGGLNKVDGAGTCSLCGNDPSRCVEKTPAKAKGVRSGQAAELGYDAFDQS